MNIIARFCLLPIKAHGTSLPRVNASLTTTHKSHNCARDIVLALGGPALACSRRATAPTFWSPIGFWKYQRRATSAKFVTASRVGTAGRMCPTVGGGRTNLPYGAATERSPESAEEDVHGVTYFTLARGGDDPARGPWSFMKCIRRSQPIHDQVDKQTIVRET